MKQQTEAKVDNAVKTLLQILRQNLEDTGTVLDQYEDTHDEKECADSRNYQALVAGHFYLEKAIKGIDRQLNK